MDPLTAYTHFIKDLNLQITDLEKKHNHHLTCHAGCSSCCKVPRSVLPIEAAYLRRYVVLDKRIKNKILRNAKRDDLCPFLIADQCTIYTNRPVICRTHGLPLLYFFPEKDGMAVTHCHLNFIDRIQTFEPEEILDMERVNQRLSAINHDFNSGKNRTDLHNLNFLRQLKIDLRTE